MTIEEKRHILLKLIVQLNLEDKIHLRTDDEGIHLDGSPYTIVDTEIEVKRLGGAIKVPGFALLKAVPYTRVSIFDETGTVDEIEVGVERRFQDIAKAAVMGILSLWVDSIIEGLDIEAQVKELFEGVEPDDFRKS